MTRIAVALAGTEAFAGGESVGDLNRQHIRQLTKSGAALRRR